MSVILVGAGPGDPGLLTVKGRQALLEAEVVVHDRLVSPAILALIPPGAEVIDAGKAAARHKIPQEQIDQILLDKARTGKRVVRLKGGDPYVFGRGGEEAALLARHGVDFQVVPGVTSAIAAAAYAGIPVTHRDCCGSFHVIAGHRRAGGPPAIDFEALVRAGGTLVFLMGVAAMPAIVSGLLAAGMDAATPAAVVERGTTPRQRRCLAPLGELMERAAAMAIASPAVILVGEVCSLGTELDWFDRLPLRGRQILVARPRGRALGAELEALGADVWSYPCVELLPIDPCPAMERALAHLTDYAWLAFTSAAGVERCWACLEGLGLDARALSPVKLAAIGPGTARALAAHGLTADCLPPVYDARHLGQHLPAEGRVLLLRAAEGSPALPAALEERGIPYDDIAVYQTNCALPPDPALRAALAAGELHGAAFTSASTVRGFVSAAGADADFTGLTGLCIGEQTAAEAAKHGIPVRVAREATIPSLVELAVQTFGDAADKTW